jgi:hypothetical protein
MLPVRMILVVEGALLQQWQLSYSSLETKMSRKKGMQIALTVGHWV